MIVLHAGVLDGEFRLWGEISWNQELRRQPLGRLKHRERRLPYDPDREALAAALDSSGLSLKSLQNQPQIKTVWLPTIGDTPLASSPLIAEPPDRKAKPSLAPWRITTIALKIEDVVELLCVWRGEELAAPGVLLGKDLAFWATAMRFAGALVARHHFLPDLFLEGGAYRARWNPVFAGKDSERLTQLAKAMPEVCRALTSDSASESHHSANGLLRELIARLVDYLVRGAVQQNGVLAKPARGGSVHDRWLGSLVSSNDLVEGDSAELAQFARHLTQWKQSLAITAGAPFRLCFRLEEPGADKPDQAADSTGGLWNVRYLLQATEDPSLIVPAAKIWNGRLGRTAVIRQLGPQAREYLLSALGQASSVSPEVEKSLSSGVPEGFSLDTTAAHRFLTETAWVLEEAGFGVMLPAWWTRKGTKLRLATRGKVRTPKLQAGGSLGFDELLRVDWQVVLGDQPLSGRELEALARLKTPLVKLRGQWVQLNADEIRAALEFWQKKKSSEITVRDALRLLLGGDSTEMGLPFEKLTASGWLGDVVNQLEEGGKVEELAAPSGFVGLLRPYQSRGYAWMDFLGRWRLGGCLADDMGLGKTVQTLALIQKNREAGESRPVLLICPTSVTSNWAKEAERFTPQLPVMLHHGAGRLKRKAFQKEAEATGIVVSSYSLLHRDLELLQSVTWSGVILDEAQNIKNAETKQARAARSLPSQYRLALTGTPVENNVGDLWSIMEFLNPGLLGSQAAFKRDLFLPIQTRRDPEAIGRLKRLTGPFVLRRLKTDKRIIDDLPEKMEMKVFCTLTKEQASLYEAVLQDAIRQLEESEGIGRKGVILATLSKLKQVCNHPAQFLGDNSPLPGRSGKLARVAEMLEEILEIRERALIFSQFAEMGELLKRHLQESFGREVLFLHGGVPRKKRDQMIERFQSESGPGMFILSLKAGGAGLNLTQANHVFHFDRWWNPAVENQATDRAFRIGQTRNVQVHKFICAGTLEDKIDEMIEQKKQIADAIVGAGEGWLTELSTDELKDLLVLRRDAVAD